MLDLNLDRLAAFLARNGHCLGSQLGYRRCDDEIYFALRIYQFEMVSCLSVSVARPNILSAQTWRKDRQILWIGKESVDVPAQAMGRMDHEGGAASKRPVRDRASFVSKISETVDGSAEEKAPLRQDRPPNPGFARRSFS